MAERHVKTKEDQADIAALETKAGVSPPPEADLFLLTQREIFYPEEVNTQLAILSKELEGTYPSMCKRIDYITYLLKGGE